ncbi:hypothetical protein [Streptomyces sp. MS2.AVA.5]|uniref:Uncharacterized protein n=1 Tax=Streptomyces achmelvichensis TaxID=3134111 RepID=A0ACC6Q849_9ACTN
MSKKQHRGALARLGAAVPHCFPLPTSESLPPRSMPRWAMDTAASPCPGSVRGRISDRDKLLRLLAYAEEVVGKLLPDEPREHVMEAYYGALRATDQKLSTGR